MAWETVFMDGFDHYADAGILQKWGAASGTTWATISTTVYRNSGKALRLANQGSTVQRFLPAARNYCVGFGFYPTVNGVAAAVTSAPATILALGNAIGTGVGGLQTALCFLSDGKLHAARGTSTSSGAVSGGVDLGASSSTVGLNQWTYIEFRVFVSDTVGELEVRINGTPEITLTGIDTQGQTYDTISALGLLCATSSNSTYNYFDDLYVRVSTSATAEAGGFLGDVRVKPLKANGDGTYSQMTPSVAGAHYVLVDEDTPSETDYLSSATAGHKETFTFEDLVDSGSVKAVQLNVYANKDDAGFRGVDLCTKSGATEDFATSAALSTTVTNKTKVWEKNPNTSNDWAQSELNAAEFGVRISADI